MRDEYRLKDLFVVTKMHLSRLHLKKKYPIQIISAESYLQITPKWVSYKFRSRFTQSSQHLTRLSMKVPRDLCRAYKRRPCSSTKLRGIFTTILFRTTVSILDFLGSKIYTLENVNVEKLRPNRRATYENYVLR